MMPTNYYHELDARIRIIELKKGHEYRVEFTANGRYMSLNVVLTPEFPNEKPAIFVNPVVSHPWIAENSNQVVGAPRLMNSTVASDLGRVIQDIIGEFQKTVPNIKHEDKSTDTSPQSHISTHSSMFPELSDLTIEELQEILEKPELQDKLIEHKPHPVELEETEELMKSIKENVIYFLSKQQMLDSLYGDVKDRILTIIRMGMNNEELHKKYQTLVKEVYDAHRIRDCLKKAALSADEDAEVIAEQFLKGNMPVEVFIAKFAEKRALGQARRAQEDRLAHQLTLLDKATNNNNNN